MAFEIFVAFVLVKNDIKLLGKMNLVVTAKVGDEQLFTPEAKNSGNWALFSQPLKFNSKLDQEVVILVQDVGLFGSKEIIGEVIIPLKRINFQEKVWHEVLNFTSKKNSGSIGLKICDHSAELPHKKPSIPI